MPAHQCDMMKKFSVKITVFLEKKFQITFLKSYAIIKKLFFSDLTVSQGSSSYEGSYVHEMWQGLFVFRNFILNLSTTDLQYCFLFDVGT